MNSRTKREHLLATSMIAGFTVLASAGMAQAQSQEAPTTEVSEIVVTGSRIVRKDFNAPSPVTTVTAETIELTSTLSVENLLNQLPSVVAGNMAT